jgi:hypothetical protein
MTQRKEHNWNEWDDENSRTPGWVMMLTSAFVSFVSCLDACLDAVGVRPPLQWSTTVVHSFLSNWTAVSFSKWTLLYLIKVKIRRFRSQRQRGLSHELSSFSRTLGSWIRIPLKAWVSVLCLFCVCVRYRSCDGLFPRPRSHTVCAKWLWNWRRHQGLIKGCRATYEWMKKVKRKVVPILN